MEVYWLVGGLVLMVAEIVVPGAVLVFLGGAAVIVALLLWVGLIENWMPAFTSWFILSLVLIITLRGLLQRFTGGDEDWQPTDEDTEAMGTVVVVTAMIRPGEPGRISHRGSTWPAICHDEVLPVGAKARLIYRENLSWIVEPHTEGTELT